MGGNLSGLGTAPSGDEAGDLFEAVLELLIAQDTLPNNTQEGEPAPEPTNPENTPAVLGVPVNFLWQQPLTNPPLNELPNSAEGLLITHDKSSQWETAFSPENFRNILFPEAAAFAEPSYEPFASLPQESATGVAEPSLPEMPARQEMPLTPLVSSDFEPAELFLSASPPISEPSVLEELDDEEVVSAHPVERALNHEFAGHKLSHASAPLDESAFSNPMTEPAHAPDAVVEQVAVHLERLIAQQERSRIQFRLDPPELGTVEIQIEVQGNSVQAWVMADQETTRHALNQHAHQLREQLAERGLSLTQFEVGYGSSNPFTEHRARSPYASQTQNTLRPPVATESLQRVAYNPYGQWTVWA